MANVLSLRQRKPLRKGRCAAGSLASGRLLSKVLSHLPQPHCNKYEDFVLNKDDRLSFVNGTLIIYNVIANCSHLRFVGWEEVASATLRERAPGILRQRLRIGSRSLSLD